MLETREPSAASMEGIPCTELKHTASDPVLYLREFCFTKESFSLYCGDETVQRVLVDQTPTLLICRLVHYPRLHNIGRSTHDGSDQSEGNRCEG